MGGDAGRLRLLAEAESIEQVVSLARERYPGIEVRVLFPIDPKAFFVEGCHPAAGSISLKVPEEGSRVSGGKRLKRENRAYARSFKCVHHSRQKGGSHG